MLVSTFGQNLRKARNALGLTQQQLGDIVQLSQAAISSYERGDRASSREVLRLANALKVDANWLEGRSTAAITRPLSTPTLAEPEANTALDIPFQFEWPFTRVSPLAYYQLDESERRMVEDLALSLVENRRRD